MKIAVHFARLGPYHLARMESVASVFLPLGWEVIALETAGSDATYNWEKTDSDANSFKRKTIFPDRVFEEISPSEIRNKIYDVLNELRPDFMAIAGWGTEDSRACLDWCKRNKTKTIVMSETREIDGVRVWWKEWFKSRIVRKFDGGLCGGESHKKYLMKLGLQENRIEFGYNVVGNRFFSQKQNKCSGSANLQIPAPYFLASNRFVERKNLAGLIQAYAKYINSFQGSDFSSQENSNVWPLVLLGDGELRGGLESLCRELGIKVFSFQDSVFSHKFQNESKSLNIKSQAERGGVVFAGFSQIKELPSFYAGAGAFIHPALEEPWGLVINEAMASGLPVLSSNNVGAAETLVINGKTGFVFDPINIAQLSELMKRISLMPENYRLQMGSSAQNHLETVLPLNSFGEGLKNLWNKINSPN